MILESRIAVTARGEDSVHAARHEVNVPGTRIVPCCSGTPSLVSESGPARSAQIFGF